MFKFTKKMEKKEKEEKRWEVILEKYKGKWVALTEDNKVVSSGYNAKTVYKKAKEKGVEIPTLFKVPKDFIPFIG